MKVTEPTRVVYPANVARGSGRVPGRFDRETRFVGVFSPLQVQTALSADFQLRDVACCPAEEQWTVGPILHHHHHRVYVCVFVCVYLEVSSVTV